MNKENTLNMSITTEVGWFALENGNMNPKVFSDLVNQLNEIILSIYKGRNTTKNENEKTYVKKEVNDKGEVLLKVSQEKVPNIIKSLVQHPVYDIQINLTGITPQREVISRMISKPFIPASVTELIPCYHGIEMSQAQNSQNNKRSI